MVSLSVPTRAGYSGLQIALHWLVALLVIFQIVGHESMIAAYKAAHEGGSVSGFDQTLAWGHVVSGIVIWFFALWRVSLRFTRGVPEHADIGQPLLEKIGSAVHFILYALLLLMPISGSVAWFLGIDQAAQAHGLAKFVLIPAVGLHVAAALAHHYWFKTDVLRRMMKPAG